MTGINDPDTSRSTGEERPSLSLAQVFDILVRRWRVWVLTPVVLVMIAVVVALLLPFEYRSSASFVPEGPGATGGGLADLVGQGVAEFGIAALAGEGRGGAFYVELLRSRSIREGVVAATYRSSEGDAIDTLVEFLGYGDLGDRLAFEKASKALGERTRVTRELSSGIVTLAVTTQDPNVTQQIVERYLEEVQQFNSTQSAVQARQRVEFTELQLDAARADLRTAEDSLQAFLERNRTYETSPSLVFARNRLDRRVAILASTVQGLELQYQQARLDLLAQIPAISIVDTPHVPQERVAPRRTMIVATVGIVAFLFSLVLALALEGVQSIKGELSVEARGVIGRLARITPIVRRRR